MLYKVDHNNPFVQEREIGSPHGKIKGNLDYPSIT